MVFYHPTSRRILPSQDVTFDESVPFYRLFPYRSAPPPPPPLFLAPEPLPGTAPVEVAVSSGAARGAASGGAASGGVEPGGAESEGAGFEGVESGGAESASPPFVGGECALGTDVLEDRQEDFECLAAAVSRFASMLLAPEGDPDAPDIPTPHSYAEAITGPYSSQWQAAMDAEMASWKSTCTYIDEVPPPEANIVDGMWISRVKRPPSSSPAFKARYVARGFRLCSCHAAHDVSCADNSRRMYNNASPANRLRASASVRTAIFYRATLDSNSAAAMAHRRPAVLAGRLSAVLARLFYATLAGGRPCCAVGRPG
ncbi:unnamed protein product [Closterium sp. NIES-53]